MESCRYEQFALLKIMFKLPRKKLSIDKIDEIEKSVLAATENGDEERIWDRLQPLIKVQSYQVNVALVLLKIIGDDHLPIDKALEVLSEVFDSHETNEDVIEKIGGVIESVRDYDDLNAPPPDNVLFDNVIRRLRELSATKQGEANEASFIAGLATTTRLCGRQYDDLAMSSYTRLVELLPKKSWAHYRQGLYFKTRGLFLQGMDANQKAIELTDEPSQACFWNLGICSTGAGDGERALEVWRGQGQKIEMGRFDLPEGSYPSCKVKLAKYPLAERLPENDYPDFEETIWIERLSPCHGIIRSVLFEDLGVDYGDVILFDGAPITYHTYGEQKIAVFPHLATLRKREYQFFDFYGTQTENRELEKVSKVLESDSVIYSHTESFRILCTTCWNNHELQHEHDETEEKHVVSGRIAAPPDVSPRKLLEQIDNALVGSPENRVFSPDLCEAAGFSDRAKIEQRRFNMLKML